MASDVVWEGKIGSVPLKVEVPHAERIVAEWESPQGRRQKSCSNIEEFERSVLFQIVIAAGETSSNIVKEVLEAVVMAQAERPAPVRQEAPRRRKQKPRGHRRSRTPPRRR
jgi:hypothetical protein